MTHFAKVIDGIVETVHVVEQDYIDSGKLGDSDNWVQTSYNTRGGVHYAPNSNKPDDGVALRYNYAGIGYSYDADKDAFIPPKPYPSWTLVESTCQWTAPVAYPDDDKRYTWDEDITNWVEIPE